MNQYIEYLVNNIHSSVVATINSENHPVTCAVDMMDYDEDGVYFLTARGKGFYKRMTENPHIALTAIKGKDTMHSVAVTIEGKVREIGADRLERLFERNPYMKDIYPTKESRTALTVFQIYEGTGEWFDLSKHPIERAEFAFGNAESKAKGYRITDKCIGCGRCYTKCPQNCIDISEKPAVIRQENCLHCGNCLEICPIGAVERNY